MTTNFNDVLDRAIEQHLAGETFRATPDQTPAQQGALDELLTTASILKTLAPVEQPAPAVLLADRNKFLHQLQTMSPPPTPLGWWPRLQVWAVHHLSWQLPEVINQRKGYGHMSSLMIKLTLIFAVIFGSVGGTAVMAAESLPDSPLYPLKLGMEQAQLAMATNPDGQAALHLEFAQTRLSEMRQLAASGQGSDEAAMTQTMAQLEQNFKMAFQLAAQAPDEAQQGLLTQTREMVQTQTQLQTQAQAQSDGATQYALQQATQLLNRVGQEAEAGLQDGETFRWRYMHGPGEPGGNPEPPCEGVDCKQAQGPVQEPAKNADCDPDCEQNQEQNREQQQEQTKNQAQTGCGEDPDCLREQNRQQNREQQATGDCGGNSNCAGDQLQEQTQTRSQIRTQACDENPTCVENRERARVRGQDGGISGLDQLESMEPAQNRHREGQDTAGQTEPPNQEQTQNQTGNCDSGCDGVPDRIQERDQDGSGDGVQHENREQVGQNDEAGQNQPSDSPSDSAPVENQNGGDNSNSGSSDSGSDSGGSSSGGSSDGGGSGKGGK